jgi:hypothetical protein
VHLIVLIKRRSPFDFTAALLAKIIEHQGWRAVAYGQGMVVSVGWNGVVVTSADGRRWTGRDSGVSDRLRAITYVDGMFVASDQGAFKSVSADGLKWTKGSDSAL